MQSHHSSKFDSWLRKNLWQLEQGLFLGFFMGSPKYNDLTSFQSSSGGNGMIELMNFFPSSTCLTAVLMFDWKDFFTSIWKIDLRGKETMMKSISFTLLLDQEVMKIVSLIPFLSRVDWSLSKARHSCSFATSLLKSFPVSVPGGSSLLWRTAWKFNWNQCLKVTRLIWL